MIDLVEFPPPCHPENSNWYQCVALCELVGLHYSTFLYVRFFEDIWAKYCEKWAIFVKFS